jgi:hypothetical protein
VLVLEVAVVLSLLDDDFCDDDDDRNDRAVGLLAVVVVEDDAADEASTTVSDDDDSLSFSPPWPSPRRGWRTFIIISYDTQSYTADGCRLSFEKR